MDFENFLLKNALTKPPANKEADHRIDINTD